GQKARQRHGTLLRARLRKAIAQGQHIDLPGERLQFGDDAPVVAVASGRCRKVARHRKADAFHHKGASYQARATCDSEIFTRIASSSRPARPSSPARAADAMASKM